MNEKRSFWQRLTRRTVPEAESIPLPAVDVTPKGEVHPLDIPPNDPLLAYIHTSPGVIEVDSLNLASPTLNSLREAGVRLALPLVSQGELIGLLNLGPRLSEQEYSSDDYRLLNNLATQASPALRVAQLARQQLAEAQERERMEQELRVARVIQETLLPKEIPTIEGWSLAAHWQPAREVGGDFYDFIDLPDGRIGILIADVTDKGVPAAMVMATTRSLLRAAAERLVEPGPVLARANELLHPDIPAKMFVTCLYIVLETSTGEMSFANAGHNLPYLRTKDGVVELRATGMPLGLMPGMDYEQKSVTIQAGQSLLLSSDGLIEAHNPDREMFGFPRTRQLMGEHPGGEGLIAHLMEALHDFTGPDYEQEDDITLATLERLPKTVGAQASDQEAGIAADEPIPLGIFSVPSEPGNERQAAAQVLESVSDLSLPGSSLKKLETAVAEATMNAMEHGNQYQAETPVKILVHKVAQNLRVQIIDQGGRSPIPENTDPDLDAKLTGEQAPRGWGRLIKNMVDEMRTFTDDHHHTIELILHLEGAEHE